MAIISEHQLLFYYLTENMEMRSIIVDKVEDVTFDPGGPDEITLQKYVLKPTVNYIMAGWYQRGFYNMQDSATEPYNDLNAIERLLMQMNWNAANYTIAKSEFRKANSEFAYYVNPVM